MTSGSRGTRPGGSSPRRVITSYSIHYTKLYDHILPDEARRFQQLADHLLFPNNLLRAPTETIEENRKGQSGLWPYAISGDLPILLVSVEEARDLGLVRLV